MHFFEQSKKINYSNFMLDFYNSNAILLEFKEGQENEKKKSNFWSCCFFAVLLLMLLMLLTGCAGNNISAEGENEKKIKVNDEYRSYIGGKTFVRADNTLFYYFPYVCMFDPSYLHLQSLDGDYDGAYIGTIDFKAE